MQKWEYRTESISAALAYTVEDKADAMLNLLGEEGWELVSTEYFVSAVWMFFKRPKALKPVMPPPLTPEEIKELQDEENSL